MRADRGQFRQVVLNLVKNSMEAIKSDASIEIACKRYGDDVEVSVADEGPGIPADEQSRIFEPFFSTKEIGTGLGLTLCQRYVEGAGGTIRYEGRAPRGSKFIVSLPAATNSAVEGEAADAAGSVKSVSV
ncbi:MAG: ATP-binding protein [Pirellulales bacterium]